MNMLSLFPLIPLVMMLGLWLSKTTRQIHAVMATGSAALLVLAGPDDTITRASANIAGLKTAYVNTINVLDILGNEKFIITEEAVKLVEEVYA